MAPSAGEAAEAFVVSAAREEGERPTCSATRFMTSCMQVELPQKPTDILRPLGGMSHTDDLTLFGIHSTKYEEFLFCTLSICSSTSLVDMRPRNMSATVR